MCTFYDKVMAAEKKNGAKKKKRKIIAFKGIREMD